MKILILNFFSKMTQSPCKPPKTLFPLFYYVAVVAGSHFSYVLHAAGFCFCSSANIVHI